MSDGPDGGRGGHPDRRLSAYVDGELPEGERRRLEAHLEGCSRCRELAEELEALVGRAGRLPDRPPREELWPGIAAEIGAQGGREGRETPLLRRTVRLGVPTLAAAAVALAFVASALTWSLAPRGSAGGGGAGGPAAATSDDAPPTSPAAGLVLASSATPHGVAELEARYREDRAALDPETRRMLDRNLRLVDRAIAQARRALAEQPGNAYLQQHLIRTVRRKAQLLSMAVRMTEAH